MRAGALGDVLLLRRAVAALRAAGHRCALLAPLHAGSVLVGSAPAEVEELLPWDSPEAAALVTEDAVPPGPLAEKLKGFDVALAYTRSRALVEGLRRSLPRVVAHDPNPPPLAGHASAWLARPLSEWGVDARGLPPTHVPRPPEAAAAEPLLRQLPERFLAVHPGSGSPAKNWPAEQYRALAEALSPSCPWLLVEGPADGAAVAPLRPLAVIAHGLSPRVLGAVLARAGLYVGNDSGVSHLAAAWGAPTLALFGPTDPGVWSPVGERVSVLASPTGRMEDLALEPVLEAAIRSSASGPPGS